MERNIPYNKLPVFWIFLGLTIIIFVLSIFYVNLVKKLMYENVYHNITELSEQTAAQLQLTITNQQKFVELMVDAIEQGQFKSLSEIFELFESDLDVYHFTRFVILDEFGNGITSDGYEVLNYPNIEEFFKQDMVYLSENRPSTVSDKQVNIYSKTFNFNGKRMVLFATIHTEDYKEILLRRLFNGEGGTYLINNDGSVLIDSFDLIQENNINLYDFIRDRYHFSNQREVQKIRMMAQSIKQKQVGTFDIQCDKNIYFVHYEKVNVNDWYVVSVAPDTIIAKELTLFLGLSLGLCFLIHVIVVGTFIYIYLLNRQKNRKLYQAAYIDSVTSLGNEAYFKENGLLCLQRHEVDTYVITLDIDHFKSFNHLYDYAFCNQILKRVGEVIVDVLPSHHITSRISNDIFASMFCYKEDIRILLNELLSSLSTVVVDGVSLDLKVSIGVYKICGDTDINKVLDKAYNARFKIKGAYSGNYYIFDDVLEQEIMMEHEIESSMEAALKNQEFKVVYQPKILVQNEKVEGAESLVRWYKDGIVIPPSQFIPLFEKNKFIIQLDLYVFEQVCKDMAEWNKKYHFVPIISVNVSKEHFALENFIDEYIRIADQYCIDRSKIELEITESSMFDSDVDILKMLRDIKEKGFVVSMDDFGTGYSSLSMLQNIPIDIIKIDRTFIEKADLMSNQNIINYIVLIAMHLGVKTIVEGVETKEQVEFVKSLGCDIIQGYYYSKPISKEAFEEYFKLHH